MTSQLISGTYIHTYTYTHTAHINLEYTSTTHIYKTRNQETSTPWDTSFSLLASERDFAESLPSWTRMLCFSLNSFSSLPFCWSCSISLSTTAVSCRTSVSSFHVMYYPPKLNQTPHPQLWISKWIPFTQIVYKDCNTVSVYLFAVVLQGWQDILHSSLDQDPTHHPKALPVWIYSL